MRIALTGSSSTGKTTLGKRLMENRRCADAVGEFVNEDARSLLRSLGHGNMDRMSRAELRQFQNLYFLQISQNEATRERFLSRQHRGSQAVTMILSGIRHEPPFQQFLKRQAGVATYLFSISAQIRNQFVCRAMRVISHVFAV